jgi:hypothetical protein
VTAWVRTDVKYDDPCTEVEIDSRNGLLASDKTPAQFRVKRQYVRLPDFKRDLAIALAKGIGIPLAPTEKSNGQSAVSITSPTNGKLISGQTPVVGDVQTGGLKDWVLEIGEGGNPTAWKEIGKGTAQVSNGILGQIPGDLKAGVYTIRLTARDSGIGDLATTVTVNVASITPGPSRTPGPGGTPPPGALPTVTPTPH